MLAAAVADACTGLARLDPDLPFSAIVQVRGLLEAAADLFWLTDGGIGPVERTRRTFLIFLRQHETAVRRLVSYSKRVSPDVDLVGLHKAIEEGWESLRLTAEGMASAGYELRTSSRPGSMYSLGEPKPSISELVDALVRTFHGLTRINLYADYSEVAHVEGGGLGSLLQSSGSSYWAPR